jgi:hypothetical protein
MKKFSLLASVFLFMLSLSAGAQNYAFQPGEKITYSVAYHVIGMYVNAGTASFTTTKASYGDAEIYHFVGEGATNSRYDWIFKVRDRYESYFDANTMKPVKAIRNVSEGKYKRYEETTFNTQTNTAVTPKGEYKVPVNIQDVISSVYYARNIDYSKYKFGDKIPFNMFLGSSVYNIYIRYVGKGTVKTKYGTVNALKLQPLLLKGDTFKGGEGMTVWVTDDNNHIPVRIESELSVGSIKVDLKQYENLRYPLALVQKQQDTNIFDN